MPPSVGTNIVLFAYPLLARSDAGCNNGSRESKGGILIFLAVMASTEGRKLNIVVEGCCHGELPKIYASVLKMQQVWARRNFNQLDFLASSDDL